MLMVLTVWGWRIKKIQPGKLPGGYLDGSIFFFAACFFLLGFYKENKWMTIAAVTNLLVGIVLHVFSLSVKNEKRAANPEFAQ